MPLYAFQKLLFVCLFVCVSELHKMSNTTGVMVAIQTTLISLSLIEVAALTKNPVCWEKRFLGFLNPINSTAHLVPLQTQNKQFIEIQYTLKNISIIILMATKI